MTENRFTITVVLSGQSETGGGFHQSITNLRMLLGDTPNRFSVKVVDVRGTFTGAINSLVSDGLLDPAAILTVPEVAPRLRDRVISDTRGGYKILRAALRLVGQEIGMSPLANFLDRSETDLVYFASPAPEASQLRIKPFVWTVWDLCHLDNPEFPEVRTYGKFEAREDANGRALRKAALVVVDSPELVTKATHYYGISREKFVVIPFSPQDSLAAFGARAGELPPEVKGLAGRFFFYPAQLWTHKNHIRIAEALQLLVEDGTDVHLVFVGKDHGAGPVIKARISALRVSDRVHFLGYVPDEVIAALYKNSIALVMASYFGPTNIPPLEAMLLGVPVIASNVHREQLGDGALFFDPDDHSALAESMRLVVRKSVNKSLIIRGRRQILKIDAARRAGRGELQHRIALLERRILT